MVKIAKNDPLYPDVEMPEFDPDCMPDVEIRKPWLQSKLIPLRAAWYDQMLALEERRGFVKDESTVETDEVSDTKDIETLKKNLRRTGRAIHVILKQLREIDELATNGNGTKEIAK